MNEILAAGWLGKKLMMFLEASSRVSFPISHLSVFGEEKGDQFCDRTSLSSKLEDAA